VCCVLGYFWFCFLYRLGDGVCGCSKSGGCVVSVWCRRLGFRDIADGLLTCLRLWNICILVLFCCLCSWFLWGFHGVVCVFVVF
jgi:hypothetical protein